MRHGRSTSTSAINPKLQQALSCLDLRLEDELTRYRRQRAGLSVAPIVLRPKQPAKKPPDFIAWEETVTTETPPVTEPPKAISFDLGASAIQEISVPAPEASAMVPYEAEMTEETIASEKERTNPPNDYLESSEHLLKSLKREEAKVEVERSFLQSLSTPLGLGTMLMLLLSSAMLGYVIMNPAIVTELWQTPSQEVAKTSEPGSNETANGTTSNSPPLDQEEFAELGLNTLSALRTKSAPIPTAIASPSPSPSPAQSAPAALVAPSPSASPSSVASPQPSTTAGSSILLPPVTVTKLPTNPLTQPARNQYYRIETPFTGDQSLAAARQVIPDAFVRSDGKIQLAATVTQAEAQRKAQELKNRGIAAEVRQP